MDKLQLLVFSFYREDTEIKELLHPLCYCRITRCRESICIDCANAKHCEEVSKLLIYLAPPFALLGFARQIILRVPGCVGNIFPIDVHSHF